MLREVGKCNDTIIAGANFLYNWRLVSAAKGLLEVMNTRDVNQHVEIGDQRQNFMICISMFTQGNLYAAKVLILNKHKTLSLLHQLFPQPFGSFQVNREILHFVDNLLADLRG